MNRWWYLFSVRKENFFARGRDLVERGSQEARVTEPMKKNTTIRSSTEINEQKKALRVFLKTRLGSEIRSSLEAEE